MGILAWIVFGLIAGAVVGGFLASLLGFGGVSGFNLGSLLVAIVGALVVLFIWRKVGGR